LAVSRGDEPVAGHLVVQRLARDLQLCDDLPDFAVMTRQGLADQFGLIGLNALDQSLV
jgi:hypothetical protein